MNTVLLDADVIIDLHKLNLWKAVTSNHKIYISSIVYREAYYYEDPSGKRQVINLSRYAGHKFIEISATIEQLSIITKQFEGLLEFDLHPGEKEALAILKANKDMFFCTCDKAAMRALGFFDLSHQGISFENLVVRSGVRKQLAIKHSERQFRQFTQEGVAIKLTHR